MQKKKKLEKIYAQIPALECKGLCHGSCGLILISGYERKLITEKIGYDPFPSQEEAKAYVKVILQQPTLAKNCELLKDGKCTVYEDRPLICRLFGAVENMKCPFGCKPNAKMLSAIVARQLLRNAQKILNS